MDRFVANKARHLFRLVLPYRGKIHQIPKPPCDVFISHLGIETRRNIAGLIHDHLWSKNIPSFLDCKTLTVGKKISHELKLAARRCKVSVLILSPSYCESWDCLYEVALLTKMGKRLVPIFWNIEPSQLGVAGQFSKRDAKRFCSAIKKVKDIDGIPFNSTTGDWSKLLKDIYDAVQGIILELDEQNVQPVHCCLRNSA